MADNTLRELTEHISWFSNGCQSVFLRPFPILGLLFSCCPTTVARLVVAFRIYTFNRVLLCRFLAHVGKEIFKFKPAFTNGNTPTAVAIIVGRFWVLASLFHGLPRAIFGFPNEAVFSFSSGISIDSTAATFRTITEKRRADNDNFASTITPTKPKRLLMWTCPSKGQDHPKTKSLIDNVHASIVQHNTRVL